MGKRGRKAWTSYADGPMPARVMAPLLGLSARTTEKALQSARRKLAQHPEAMRDVIAAGDEVRAQCERPAGLPACGSVECLPWYRQPYYGEGENDES